jgi:hypothetical protein
MPPQVTFNPAHSCYTWMTLYTNELSYWCVTAECETQCSIWCNKLTVYAVRLMSLPVANEYACLMVRGYKTAETKKTTHLKCMHGQYVVLYVSQLPATGTLSEAMLLHRGHLTKLVDELRQHWPDVSDVMKLVCAPELAVQACNTDTRRDHA